MKKLLYIVSTLLLIVLVSAFTAGTPSIDKKVAVGDTVSVNINVHQSKSLQQQTNTLYESLVKDLDSRTNLDNAKAKLLNKISDEYRENNFSTLDKLCNEYGYSTESILKMTKRDINLKFIGSLLTLLVTIILLVYFIQKSIRDKLDWKLVLIFSIVIMLGLYILNTHLQNVLMYIFNHDYLTIKEIIKFF